MLVYKYFENDVNKELIDIQFATYDYSISLLFIAIKFVYVDNANAVLYFEEDQLVELRNISTFDHRLIQSAHDLYAAVFRFNVKNGDYAKTLFEPNENELIEHFNLKFRDIDFLKSVPQNYWYLIKHWFDFLEGIVNENLEITKELANAVIRYNVSKDHLNKAWKSSSKAAALIINHYNHIPWVKTLKPD